MNLIELLEREGVQPPLDDEVEVSVFGAGVGECILVHFGFKKWMIVDSCTEPGFRSPIGLDYLEFLGVDVKNDVKLFVVTHWHDDHIRGASQILEECQSAELVISDACTKEEFTKLVAIQSGTSDVSETRIDEFIQIYKTLKSSSSRKFHFASSNKRIIKISETGLEVIVESLSPSSEEQRRSKTMFAHFANIKPGETKKVVLPGGPNHTAVVLFVKINERSILLGSDLEEGNVPTIGWRAILSSAWPGTKSQIFKIPHHGSSNAHLKNVWDEMLIEKPSSFLTPFTKSDLPRESDIERILSFTNEAYITSEKRPRSPKRRDNAVDKTIKRFVKSLRPIESHMGQIRYRAKINGVDGITRTFGLAKKLEAKAI